MADRPAPIPRRLLLERMLNFSDGVFAIVLTLLAIDLKPPAGFDDAHLLQGLAGMSVALGAFVQSFVLVGIFWLTHLVILRALAEFDWIVAVVNLVCLFTVVVTPFATSLVAHDGNQGVAWRVYCGAIIAISLSQAALIIASHRNEPQLVHAEHHGRLWIRLARVCSPAAAFAIGLVLSFLGQTTLSSVCPAGVPVFLLLARWLAPDSDGRGPHRKQAPAVQSSV
jgi:uncharacterized membrane protein